MSVSLKKVISTSSVKEFINLEFEIYKNEKFWVTPIKNDEKKALYIENPVLEFCKVKFFLAYKNEKYVGRIGAIFHKTYNDKVGRKYGRFNRIEFINDIKVFDALINTACEFFKKRRHGAHTHGPLGYNNLGTQGSTHSRF